MPRKRLFFDIETSPNIALTWRTGYKISLSHDNILKERAIICICYKWEGEEKAHALTWSKSQDDKSMLQKFAKVISKADEVVGHNGDRFDIKWLYTRCLYHKIKINPEIKTIDTLKVARSKFYFNSNKLDYIAQFLGHGGKMDTGGFALWKSIVLDKCKKSLDKMVEYCKTDVVILEKVFKDIEYYSKPKTHYGVLNGGQKYSCPCCGHNRPVLNMTRTTASGVVKRLMKCKNSKCNKYYTISNKAYQDLLTDRLKGN
tara:strand:- start:808 stop:1581 length:774 start_codon:yes stop_codon:yes gene_type:complete